MVVLMSICVNILKLGICIHRLRFCIRMRRNGRSKKQGTDLPAAAVSFRACLDAEALKTPVLLGLSHRDYWAPVGHGASSPYVVMVCVFNERAGTQEYSPVPPILSQPTCACVRFPSGQACDVAPASPVGNK